jgi:hypothetical protein
MLSMATTRGARMMHWLGYLVLLAIIIEGTSALICRLSLLQSRGFLWRPDLELARKNWEVLSPIVDEEIGGRRTDGPKDNSEFPDATKVGGGAYGDSFVYGTEVDPGEGWVELLSRSWGCRVNNYAVGGYGTDQALLRFRQTYDNAPFVLLGINPNNVTDNVSQYDYFVEPDPLALKGRFVLDEHDQLQWLPRPHLDVDGFVALNRDPRSFLPRSYLLPDTPDGPVISAFPYTATLARIALMPRLHNILTRRAEWSGFYQADHPSGALRLMTAICESFVRLAEQRHMRALVVLLPLAHSFRERANFGKFEYEPLVAALEGRGIAVFDPGPAMLDNLEGRSVCDFYTTQHPETALLTSPVPCGGHYSVAGNAMVARLVEAEIRRRGIWRAN